MEMTTYVKTGSLSVATVASISSSVHRLHTDTAIVHQTIFCAFCEILTTQRQKFVGKVKNPCLWNKNWRDSGLGAQIQSQHSKSNVE